MPEIEKLIENRFFNILIEQQEGFEDSQIGIYQKLVFLRFEEVIKNAFPIFVSFINEETLTYLIKEFMKKTPKRPLMWQIANEFRKFVKKNKLFENQKFLYEVLYFDNIEIELFMKKYKEYDVANFSFKQNYKLSKSARIKKFKYNIINGNYNEKRENFLLIYYDFDSNNVVYREINALLFHLLKDLKPFAINEILKKLCKENCIDFKEAKKILEEPLNELFFKKILKLSKI